MHELSRVVSKSSVDAISSAVRITEYIASLSCAEDAVIVLVALDVERLPSYIVLQVNDQSGAA